MINLGAISAALFVWVSATTALAAEDLTLPEEVQMEEQQKTGDPGSGPNALSEEQIKKVEKGEPGMEVGQAQEGDFQNQSVIKFLDSLNFGKDQFLPDSSFVKDGKLTSSMLK